MTRNKRKAIRLRARAEWSIYENKQLQAKEQENKRRIRQIHALYPRGISDLFERASRQQTSLGD